MERRGARRRAARRPRWPGLAAAGLLLACALSAAAAAAADEQPPLSSPQPLPASGAPEGAVYADEGTSPQQPPPPRPSSSQQGAAAAAEGQAAPGPSPAPAPQPSVAPGAVYADEGTSPQPPPSPQPSPSPSPQPSPGGPSETNASSSPLPPPGASPTANASSPPRSDVYDPWRYNRACRYSARGVPSDLFQNGYDGGAGFLFPLEMGRAIDNYASPWEACFGPKEPYSLAAIAGGAKLPCRYWVEAGGTYAYEEEHACDVLMKVGECVCVYVCALMGREGDNDQRVPGVCVCWDGREGESEQCVLVCLCVCSVCGVFAGARDRVSGREAEKPCASPRPP
jgi:hypothetical protein